MEHEAFVERVLAHLPSGNPTKYEFAHWNHGGRPTDEGFGLVPVPGADPERIIGAVMDVDHYVGNIEYVASCRSVVDPRFVKPGAVRFYQRLDLPVLGAIHHELVLHDLGTRNGYRVAAWSLQRAETDALSAKDGLRSDYNHGAWLAKPGLVGYALGSAPKRDDVGFLKWKALTTGADVAASKVVRANIEGLAKWASRR
ncbi:MAG: hypothetical protein ABMB14_14805 [Myxococcota bacterium]